MRRTCGWAGRSAMRSQPVLLGLGVALLPLATSGGAFALPSTTIVIEQVEADAPAGGTDTAHEWFELRNVSGSVQTLAGWTIADNSSSVVLPPVVLAPGCSVIFASDVDVFDADYPAHAEYVLGLGQPIGSGLANGGDRLTLSDASAAVVDCVSFGTNVECLVPAAAVANPIQTLQRNPPGTDSDTSGDWIAAPLVLPGACAARVFVDGFETADRRRWSNPECGLGTFVNETDVGNELDYCNIQFPQVTMVNAGQVTELIFGRVYEAGVTPDPGSNPSVLAEVGYGLVNSDPTQPATMCQWSYVSAAFNVQVLNDDEYDATFVAPAVAGSYSYVFRFSLNGIDWTACDIDGAGANLGLTFSPAQLGVITVNP
jgi:hypothetical protein